MVTFNFISLTTDVVHNRPIRLRVACLAAVFCAGILTAAERPPLTFDPGTLAGGRIADAGRSGAALLTGPGVQVDADGVGGMDALVFDGSGVCTFDVKAVAQRFTGEAFSVAFWFRVDEPHDGTLGFGYEIREDGAPARLQLTHSLKTKPTSWGAKGVGARADRELRKGYWHHAAFVFSVPESRFTAYLDGLIQNTSNIHAEEPSALIDFIRPLGENFRGRITGVTLWDRAAPVDELLAFKPGAAEREALRARFLGLRDGSKHAPFRTWSEARADEVDALAGGTDVTTWQALRDASWKGAPLAAWAAGLPAASSMSDAPMLALSIYPYSHVKRLPHVLPEDGRVVDTLPVTAARGEYESVSFVLVPFRDVGTFEIVPTALTGPGGALPTDALDLKVVKCWFAPNSAWHSYFAGGREFPTLIPELLLHDDALMRVDEDTRSNHLRLSEASGPRYVDVSQRASADTIPEFNYLIEPVYDSTTLQPLPLTSMRGQQFWLTVCPPPEAAPGLYTARLALKTDGVAVGELRVELTVLPFVLPVPKTRYDLTRDFIGAMMNHIVLSGQVEMGKSQERAERRLLAELRNMAAHNALHPFGPSFDKPENAVWSIRQLALMAKAGLPCRPLYGVGMGTDIPSFTALEKPQEAPEAFEAGMNRFKKRIDRVLPMFDHYLGHRDVHYYGFDEAGPSGVAREFPFFAYLNSQGAKIFITSGVSRYAGYAVDVNDHPVGINEELASQWHTAGARLLSYAAPFTGPENPEVWRRTKGLRLYLANYDGLGEYNYYEGARIWNDFASGYQPYRNFNLVYPTADGVVDTVAWEGFREAFDDVRYLTLLRLLATEAMATTDASTVREGKRALIWAECINAETVDLDEMRSEAIVWILALATKLPDSPHLQVEPQPLVQIPALLDPLPEDPLVSARLQRKRFAYDQAVPFYKKAVARTDVPLAERMTVLEELATCYRDLRQRDPALGALKAILALDGLSRTDEALIWVEIGRMHVYPMTYDERPTAEAIRLATEAYTQAEKVGKLPANTLATAWVALSEAQARVGEFNTAIATCQRALRLTGLGGRDKNPVYVALGDHLAARGDYKRAVHCYELGIDANKFNVLEKIAVAARAGKDYAKAQSAYSDLLPLSGEVTNKKIRNQLRMLTQVAKPTLGSKSPDLLGDDLLGDDFLLGGGAAFELDDPVFAP